MLLGKSDVRNPLSIKSEHIKNIEATKTLRDLVGKQYLEEMIAIKLSKKENEIFENIINIFPIENIKDSTTEEDLSKEIFSYINDSLNEDSKNRITKKAMIFLSYIVDMSDFEKDLVEKNKRIWIEFLHFAADFDINFDELEKQVNSLVNINTPLEFEKRLNAYLNTLPKQYQAQMYLYIRSLVDYTKKLPENMNTKKYEQDFHYAYHKEMEGLTDEEIADALRFYKEMKKRVGGDNGNK
jgi:hypothetical protein